MYLLGFVAWAVLWIIIAFWPARVAKRKGYSFVGFFVLSIIFFPLALILAYVIRDRNAAEHKRERAIEDSAPEF